ncbi:MAG: helix-turn-helix domain-containing protein [Acidimicrobiales bacterium]
MVKNIETQEQAARLQELKRVRAEALEHFYAAVEFARQRRKIIEAFLADGFSQADVAREMGVSRQAIQKWIKVGREPRGAKAKS